VSAGDTSRAVSFVIPCIRDAFAAGYGSWVHSLLAQIVKTYTANSSFLRGEGLDVLQWWMFLNAHSVDISKDIHSYEAHALQWDINSCVYRSLFTQAIAAMDGGHQLAATQVMQTGTSHKAAAVPTSSYVSYFRNALRHCFPSVCFHQRCRLCCAREKSFLTTFR
jgi:hypothetical protein